MTKPSWNDAPSWAEYLAMNHDGKWRWHQHEPKALSNGTWQAKEGSNTSAERGWFDTLEKKPPFTFDGINKQAANQAKHLTKDRHRNIMTVQGVDKSGFGLNFDVHTNILLSRDSSEWEAEAKTANEHRCMVLMHPQFLLDLLASLDAARLENEDLKIRFEEAVKKLKG
jgi:hypothetical protein